MSPVIFQKGKHASSILKNMDHLNEILMQKDNLTTPRFCGSNIGNHYISIHQLNYYQYFKKYSQKQMLLVGFFYSRTDY